jgi:hypothetical protein
MSVVIVGIFPSLSTSSPSRRCDVLVCMFFCFSCCQLTVIFRCSGDDIRSVCVFGALPWRGQLVVLDRLCARLRALRFYPREPLDSGTESVTTFGDVAVHVIVFCANICMC